MFENTRSRDCYILSRVYRQTERDMQFSYYFRTRLTADEQRDTEKKKKKRRLGRRLTILLLRDDKNGLWGRVEKIENKLLTWASGRPFHVVFLQSCARDATIPEKQSCTTIAKAKNCETYQLEKKKLVCLTQIIFYTTILVVVVYITHTIVPGGLDGHTTEWTNHNSMAWWFKHQKETKN